MNINEIKFYVKGFLSSIGGVNVDVNIDDFAKINIYVEKKINGEIYRMDNQFDVGVIVRSKNSVSLLRHYLEDLKRRILIDFHKTENPNEANN